MKYLKIILKIRETKIAIEYLIHELHMIIFSFGIQELHPMESK